MKKAIYAEYAESIEKREYAEYPDAIKKARDGLSTVSANGT